MKVYSLNGLSTKIECFLVYRKIDVLFQLNLKVDNLNDISPF